MLPLPVTSYLLKSVSLLMIVTFTVTTDFRYSSNNNSTRSQLTSTRYFTRRTHNTKRDKGRATTTFYNGRKRTGSLPLSPEDVNLWRKRKKTTQRKGRQKTDGSKTTTSKYIHTATEAANKANQTVLKLNNASKQRR